METATFSMDSTVSMEPKKASAGLGACGSGWGLGAGHPGGPAPLGLEEPGPASQAPGGFELWTLGAQPGSGFCRVHRHQETQPGLLELSGSGGSLSNNLGPRGWLPDPSLPGLALRSHPQQPTGPRMLRWGRAQKPALPAPLGSSRPGPAPHQGLRLRLGLC